MEKNSMEKKTYSKPCVGFVDFSLTGRIASTCVHDGTNTDSNTCGYTDGSGWIVYAQNSFCDIGTDVEFCYHAPTEDNSIFGS